MWGRVTSPPYCDGHEFKLDWPGVQIKFHGDSGLPEILLASKTLQLSVKAGSNPTFLEPRPVPYASRPKVEAELDRVQYWSQLVLVNWSTPIVPIIKREGSVTI